MSLKETIESAAREVFRFSCSCVGFFLGRYLIVRFCEQLSLLISNYLFRNVLLWLGGSAEGLPWQVGKIPGLLLSDEVIPLGGLIGFSLGSKISDPVLNLTSNSIVFSFEKTKTSFYTLSEMLGVAAEAVKKKNLTGKREYAI